MQKNPIAAEIARALINATHFDNAKKELEEELVRLSAEFEALIVSGGADTPEKAERKKNVEFQIKFNLRKQSMFQEALTEVRAIIGSASQEELAKAHLLVPPINAAVDSVDNPKVNLN